MTISVLERLHASLCVSVIVRARSRFQTKPSRPSQRANRMLSLLHSNRFHFFSAVFVHIHTVIEILCCVVQSFVCTIFCSRFCTRNSLLSLDRLTGVTRAFVLDVLLCVATFFPSDFYNVLFSPDMTVFLLFTNGKSQMHTHTHKHTSAQSHMCELIPIDGTWLQQLLSVKQKQT